MVLGDDGFDDSGRFPSEGIAIPEEVETFTSSPVDVKDTSTELREESYEEKEQRWRSNAQARKLAKKAAHDSAIVIVSLLDGLAIMLFGISAKMNDTEREMIVEPLERIVLRMDFISSSALEKVSDPIALVIGLVIWGSRLYREQKDQGARKEERKEEVGMEQPEQPLTVPTPDEVLLTEQMRAPIELRAQIGKMP